MESVPPQGECIDVHHKVALMTGGIVETISQDLVTDKNKALFLKVLDLFDANIFGIDIIMEQGIDVDYDQQKCIMLEVNSRPYLKMHDYPRYGEKPDLSAHYESLDQLSVSDRDIF